jgi:hypothetical protein
LNEGEIKETAKEGRDKSKESKKELLKAGPNQGKK